MNGRFYWLKLKKDFFKRHDIVYLRSLEDGDEIVLIYLMLLLESVDHEGELRFSDNIPYSVEMLASITDMPIVLVDRALCLFSDLGLITNDENDTIKLPKVHEMIGSASDSDEARRSKRYRERKKAERDETSQQNVTSVTESVTERHESKSKRQSKSKSKRQSIDFFSKKNTFVEPTIEEIYEYCESRHNGINPQNFYDYYSAKGWTLGNSNKQMSDWKAAIRAWETNQKRFNEGD